MDLISVSKKLFSNLYQHLHQYRKQQGLYGLRKLEDQAVKATHKIDEIAYELIEQELADMPIDLYVEGFAPLMGRDAKYVFYVDPVDGSRNWDRGVGDPCFCLAVRKKDAPKRFQDLIFAFVGGYHSRDEYYIKEGKAFYNSYLLEEEMEISTANCAQELRQAHAYLKPGYSAAQAHFDYCMPLYQVVKDIRAIDNSGMDLCEIARSAADFSIEARQLSDFYNLLAFPIFHAAGGVITDLNGKDLLDQYFEEEHDYDFIAAGNPALLKDILSFVRKNIP